MRCLVVAVLVLARVAGAQQSAVQASKSSVDPSAFQQLGHSVLRDLIETNTTGSSGNTTTAAEQLQVRFRDAGFPDADVQVVGPTAKN